MKDQKSEDLRGRFLIGLIGVLFIAWGVVMAFPVGTTAQSEKGPIKVGVAEALTGPATALGHHSLWGTQLAVKRINGDGGINGRKLELIVEDTKTNAAEAIKAYRKLVLLDKVDFVLAGTLSIDGLAMVKPAKEMKTLTLITVPESSLITSEQLNRYIFRVNVDCRHKARALGPWLVNNVEKRWNIIYHDFAWGQELRNNFKEQFEKNGGTVTNTIPIPLGTMDFTSYLEKLDPSAPGVFLAVSGEDSVRLAIQINEFGINKKYKLAGTCDTIFPENFEKLGKAVDGAYIVEQYPPVMMSPVDTPADKKFREEFKELSKGIEPGPHSWAGYEWLFIMKHAMEKVKYQNKNDIPNVIKTLEDLRLPKDNNIVQGPAYIRGEDHQGFIRMYIWQIKDGKATMKKVVEPEEVIFPPFKDIRTEPF
jgi:branched-chain amino acid transport system substrate-binding protein